MKKAVNARLFDNKMVSIQLLRGAAASLVVAAHSFGQLPATDFFISPKTGHFGVDVFFVISGFVMATIIWTRPTTTPKFLWDRIRRIVPIYWFYTLLAALLAFTIPQAFRGTEFSLSHLLQSLAFIPHENPTTGSFSPLLRLGWTLNFEMFFYLILAITMAVIGRTHVLFTAVVLAAVGLAAAIWPPTGWVEEGSVDTSSPLGFYANSLLVEFALGMLLAFVARNSWLPVLSAAHATIVLIISLIGAAFAVELAIYEDWRGLLVGALAFAVVAAGLMAEDDLRKQNLQRLCLVGDASFTIYLSHLFFLSPLRIAVGWFFTLGESFAVDMAFVVFTWVAAIVFGVVAYIIIERPMVSFIGSNLAKPSDMTGRCS